MKTAVSIPDQVYEDADRLARRLGLTRSALYTRALRQMLKQEDDASITAALDELYATEDSSMDRVLKELQRRALAEPW
jgi:metal-responsive CopG/Arc/MetJ family transcriptional regulator